MDNTFGNFAESLPIRYKNLGLQKAIDRNPLQACFEWRHSGLNSVLLTIVQIEGRSPRHVGSQMAVNEQKDVYGYLTSGCVENELARKAIEVMQSGQNCSERYGRGSRFIDLRLPCGSGIDVYFDQSLSLEVLHTAHLNICKRKPFFLITDLKKGHSRIPLGHCEMQGTKLEAGVFYRAYVPAIKTRIFGAGFGMLQLAKLLLACGYEAELFSRDMPTMAAASSLAISVTRLSDDIICKPPVSDHWTANVVMFHDHSDEHILLEQLLRTDSFYIGAIGSRAINDMRLELLRTRGFNESQLQRVIAPAGLVTGARSATEIACGIMAEIFLHAREQGLTH